MGGIDAAHRILHAGLCQLPDCRPKRESAAGAGKKDIWHKIREGLCPGTQQVSLSSGTKHFLSPSKFPSLSKFPELVEVP